MENWRILITPALPGALNMAMDVTIASFVNAGKVPPTIRFYSWQPYCLSLGYHQGSAQIDLQTCKENGVDVTRRPTGGKAVYHAEEFTYSVMIPQKSRLYRNTVTESYLLLAEWLIAALKKLGLPVDLAPQLRLSQRQRQFRNMSCFSSASDYEIVVNNRKLIGSAQRRLSNVLLQHGSILVGSEHQNVAKFIRQSVEKQSEMLVYLKKRTTCLQEWLGNTVPNLSEFAELLTQTWQKMFDVKTARAELSSAELKQAEEQKKEFDIFSCEKLTKVRD